MKIKPVQDLLSDYTFEEATEDLIEEIDRHFKKDRIKIPPLILKVFSFNIPKTKDLFKEFERNGYCFEFLDNDIYIRVSSKEIKTFVKSLIAPTFSRLLDEKTAVDLVISLINKSPEEWRRPIPSSSVYGNPTTAHTFRGNEISLTVDLEKKFIEVTKSPENVKIFSGRIAINDKEVFLIRDAFKTLNIHQRDLIPKMNTRFNKENVSLEDSLVLALKTELESA